MSVTGRSRCSICKVSFPNPQILARHMAMPHNFRKGPFAPAAEKKRGPLGSGSNNDLHDSQEGGVQTAIRSSQGMSRMGAPVRIDAEHQGALDATFLEPTVLEPTSLENHHTDERSLSEGAAVPDQRSRMSIGSLVHNGSAEPSEPVRGTNLEGAPNTSSCLTFTNLVYEFYVDFKDGHKLLWANVEKPTALRPLRQSRVIVEYCMSNRLQGSEIAALYDLQVKLERLREEDSPSWIQADFPKVSALQSRVLQERRFAVMSQGWREALITNRFGKVERGVFLPVRRLLAKIVEDYGGVQNLVQYHEEVDSEGNRLFSNPVNADAMRLDHESMAGTQENPVYFSLYCDKTMLAKCGSADGFAVRLRVDNLKGANCSWYEIGYAPILSAPAKASAQDLSNARLELFQRFLFMLLRDIVNPDFYTDNKKHPQLLHKISPRLLSFPSDQPQERENLCLMRGQSNQDCSRCTFRSLEERHFNRNRRVEQLPAAPNKPLKRVRRSGQNPTASNKRRKPSHPPRSALPGSSQLEQGVQPPMLPIPPALGRVTFDRFEPRDVRTTLDLQLKAAKLDIELRVHKEEAGSDLQVRKERRRISREFAEVKRILAQQSALPLPPALAIIDGIGSKPLRLYDTVVIDLLHTFDLGISRQFCDDAFTVFGRSSYTVTRSKTNLVRAANNRIRLLPPESECRTYAPFRLKDTEKQASFTGKQRRLLCPFLWVAVIGLNEKEPPDDDGLFITALNLDFIQSELKGVNRSPSDCRRKQSSIEALQRRIQRACDLFQELFITNENTKLHRLRVHLAEQLIGFGNPIMSDTGPNETLHRGLKKSYEATNKRPELINRQLLQVKIGAEQVKQDYSENVVDHLLLTRTRRVSAEHTGIGSDETVQPLSYTPSFQEKLLAQELSDVLRDHKERVGALSPDAAFNAICSKKDMFDCYLFSERRQIDIEARLEWCGESVKVRQRLYAGKGFQKWGGDRLDAIRFCFMEHGVEKTAYGVVRGIFVRNKTVENNFAGVVIVLVCLLETVNPESGNTKIVREYGYERLKYALEKEEVRVLCVPISNVQRKAVIVQDFWDGTKRFGFEVALDTLPASKEDRKAARFFIVKNYQFTAVGETQL